MRPMEEVLRAIFVVLLCLAKGSYEACTDMIAGIDATKVGTMCTDSVINGTNVYIDTRFATNMTLSAGTVCSCDVQSQHGKIMNVTSLFTGSQGRDCDSTLNYASSGLPGSSRNASCRMEQFEVTSEDMTINFIKMHAPYGSNYCVSIALEYCTSTEFQCNDGECIHESGRCDYLPHCADSSDEDNCPSGTCVEGQVLCNDGVTCINPDKWCDRTPDCPDSSDEPPSCGGMTPTTPSKSSSAVPLVTITCTKSLQTSTTAVNTGISPTIQNEDNISVYYAFIALVSVASICIINAFVIVLRARLIHRTHNRVETIY